MYKKKKKIEKQQARIQREQLMTDYLREKGWQQSGTLGDVWKTDNWNIGSDHKPTVVLSLTRAYQVQLKLDKAGYQKPITTDDDLVAKING